MSKPSSIYPLLRYPTGVTLKHANRFIHSFIQH